VILIASCAFICSSSFRLRGVGRLNLLRVLYLHSFINRPQYLSAILPVGILFLIFSQIRLLPPLLVQLKFHHHHHHHQIMEEYHPLV
jgi:hypothetical protein